MPVGIMLTFYLRCKQTQKKPLNVLFVNCAKQTKNVMCKILDAFKENEMDK